MKGPKTFSATGIYGTKGVPDPANYPAGRGWGAASWTDQSGDFWLFGGYASGSGGSLNDLWKYDVAANVWTWMSGSMNIYDPGSYTQMGIPNPVDYPASRNEANAVWVDTNNNLWMFGGYGTGMMDDLWKYDIATGMWTWMHGSSTGGVPANHGTKGVPAPTNTPGGRQCYSAWLSPSGDLMLYGGAGFGQFALSTYSDTWEFDISLGQWTWVAGPSNPDPPVSSGAECDASDAYNPASRYENRATGIDACGNVFTFGGFSSVNAHFNDLWWYDRGLHEWSWIAGDLTTNQTTVFGTKGVPAVGPKPGARGGSVLWLDDQSNIWIFGGLNFVSGVYDYNELWRFQIDTSCHIHLCTVTFKADIRDASCSGKCDGRIELTVLTGTPPFTFQWSHGPTTDSVGGLCAGNYSVTVTDIDGNDVVGNFLIKEPPPLTVLAGNDTTIEYGQSVQLNATSAGWQVTYNWEPPVDLSCTDCQNPVATPLMTTTYTVTVTDSAGCQGMDVITITVVDNVGLYVPNAFSPNGDGENDFIFVFVTGSNVLDVFNIYNRWGQLVFSTNVIQNGQSLGWDGTFKGEPQPVGCYAFVARAVDANGQDQLVTGNITLMR
jgi:gliding motility-associated-like protein